MNEHFDIKKDRAPIHCGEIFRFRTEELSEDYELALRLNKTFLRGWKLISVFT